jgi:beta-lactamase regulating signal transducer with metallopeptidase domain
MSTSTDFLNTLAWSLLHFLWQGAAIAACAAALMLVFHKPNSRYLVGIAALALMLASFAITFALLSGSSGATYSAPGAPAAVLASPLGASAYSVTGFVEAQAANSSPFDFLWIARGWMVGVSIFALRIAFGLLLIEHLRRRNLLALPAGVEEKFRALQQRLGIRRVIRYCECRLLGVPAVIGFFRPIVLVPMRALTGLTEEQLEAVIAHELGHIKRFDVAVNFFQVIAETLFFFHPAVWWLNKRIRADREDCCDDVAIAACGGRVGYARALATMEGWRDVPNFAMAATGSQVAARVARLLGVSQKSPGSTRTAGVFTASMVLAAALIAGAVSIGVANPALAQVAGVSAEMPEPAAPVEAPIPVAPVEGSAPVAPLEEPTPVAPVAGSTPVAPLEPPTPDVPLEAAPPVKVPVPKAAPVPKPVRVPKPAPPAPPAPPVPTSRASDAPRGASYIAEMKSAGLENLDIDQLIALRTSDVTPEYIREIRSVGLTPDVNQLVAMKIHGITPDYVKGIRAMGFKPDVNELIAMKIHDVTPEYVKGMRDLGINPDAQVFIGMKIQDVTPEYVRQIRSAGFTPNNDQLIAMKIQDVTPEYRRALEAAGFKMDVSELIQAKIMDITPEFIEQARAHGFRDLSVGKLIQLKNADIF